MKINLLFITSLLLLSQNLGAFTGSEFRNNDGLLEIIRDISIRYNVHFTYDREIVEDVEVAHYTPEAYASVDEALSQVLAGTKLKYVMLETKYVIIYQDDAEGMKSLEQMVEVLEKLVSQNKEKRFVSPISLLESSTSFRNVHLQKHRMVLDVSGIVTDQVGEPLIGVNVMVQGTTKGTATDFEGRFTLEDVNEKATLIFSYVGYQSQEVTLNGRSDISVTMIEDSQTLEEVVVVGYGTQKRETITGSVETIRAEKLESRSVGSVMESLQGQVSGLNLVRTSGQPGNQSYMFMIRGTSTFTNNPVLTLIDGVPSSLERINPNDIESITVLKDAASAAIYGSRATGGVILVTTKTGSNGKPKISLNSSVGFQNPTRFPEKVSALDHALLSNEARINDGANPKYSDEEIQRFSSPNWKDYSWDDYMFRNGLMNNHNISISGGSDSYKYYLSGGYLGQEGIIINTDYKRLSLQFNQDIKISNKINVELKAGYIPSTQISPAANRLGNMLSFVAAQPNTDQVITSDNRWLSNSTNTGGGNPIGLASEDGGQKQIKADRIQGNATISYRILPKVKLSGAYGLLRSQSRTRDYQKILTLYQQTDHDLVSSISEDNFLDIGYVNNVRQNTSLLIDYNNRIGEHSFSFMGGTTAEWYLNTSDNISTRDFLTDNIYSVNAGTTDPTLWRISGAASDWALASFLSRITYDFKNKYFLETAFRYDGSSRFATGLKWGIFPSASVGWIVSNENFLKASNIISFLKLRGSLGQVGNQNVGDYPFVSTLKQTGYYFNGNPRRGVTIAGASNPLLTWETKSAFNVGIDGYILDNKLGISFDIFKERTSDILMKLPLPTTYGLQEPVQNVGIVDNKGWELQLSYNNNVDKFSYGLNFQISDAINKVIDMGGVSPIISGNTITEEGYSMNEWFGWRAIGYFQTDEEVNSSSFQNPKTSPGDIRYEENGGDPNTISFDDRVRLGSSDARFPYGASISLSYKQFDLQIFGQGLLKHTVWSNGWTANNFDRENSTLRTYHLDRWTPDNPNARFPKTRMGSGADRSGINDSFSSFWLENASYFRMKNIQLGYDFSSDFISKYGVNSFRIYLSGENLLTFTKYLGYDPEAPSGTGSRLLETRYPLAKVLNFGINLNF